MIAPNRPSLGAGGAPIGPAAGPSADIGMETPMSAMPSISPSLSQGPTLSTGATNGTATGASSTGDFVFNGSKGNPQSMMQTVLIALAVGGAAWIIARRM